MKPLLIIPPAPTRWPALLELLGPSVVDPWLASLERRIRHGVAGAEDAIAVIPAGGVDLAAAYIHKRGEIGLLGNVFTRPEHRERGFARQLTEALLSWFDMTGGRWLYLSATRALEEGLFQKFGFDVLCEASRAPHDRITLIRRSPGAAPQPAYDSIDAATTRALSRGDWPEAVAFLQYFDGPDPRVPLGESAVSAELLTLDLLDHQERGTCELVGVWRGPRIVGLATIATDRPGQRTYALLMPHSSAPPELRTAVEEAARARGYSHVEYPMQALLDRQG